MKVDFGGDILTDGKQSPIISLESDAFSSRLGHNLIQKGYESKLTVCFPGVDGELTSDYLTSICEKFCVETISIDIDDWKHSLRTVYEYVKNEHPGNTIPNMLSVLDSSLCNMLDIKKRWKIGRLHSAILKSVLIHNYSHVLMFLIFRRRIRSLIYSK